MKAKEGYSFRRYCYFIFICCTFTFIILYNTYGQWKLYPSKQVTSARKHSIVVVCITSRCLMSNGFEASVVHRNKTNIRNRRLWREQLLNFSLRKDASSSLPSPFAKGNLLPRHSNKTPRKQWKTKFISNAIVADQQHHRTNAILPSSTTFADHNKGGEFNHGNKGLQNNLLLLNNQTADMASYGDQMTGFRKRLPQVIIIGVKKAGTKALLTFLSQHPNIKTCKTEIHYFDKYYMNGLNWYKNQMPKSYPYQVTIEKSPRYFVTRNVPERIRRMSAKVKLLVIFRNPLQRAISDYVHIRARGRKALDSQSFESLIFVNNENKTVNRHSELISTGIYSAHLKKWLDIFSRDQMYFIDGDSLIRNPSKEIIAVQEFLNIPVVIKEENFVFNLAKRFYCVYKNSQQESMGRIKDDSNVICLGKSKGRPHPYVKPETLKILGEFYKPYNQQLYKMTGKNFNWFS